MLIESGEVSDADAASGRVQGALEPCSVWVRHHLSGHKTWIWDKKEKNRLIG